MFPLPLMATLKLSTNYQNVKKNTLSVLRGCFLRFWIHWSWFHISLMSSKCFLKMTLPTLRMAFSRLLKMLKILKNTLPMLRKHFPNFLDTLKLVPSFSLFFQTHSKPTPLALPKAYSKLQIWYGLISIDFVINLFGGFCFFHKTKATLCFPFHNL